MEKLISLIIPIYNEEQNIPELYRQLNKITRDIKSQFNCEIIFVNDGSVDQSDTLIRELAKSDCRIQYIEFSRNFGKEIATSAGFYYAAGDAAIMLDADLQHPVELIPEFLKKWESGADIVVGIREKNHGEGFIKKYGSFIFYKIMNQIGDIPLISGSTDFRLLDRKIINEFNKFTERNRMTRSLVDWLGFRRDYIYFTANKRFAGEARYSYLKLVKLALSTFVSQSLFPLKIAGHVGVFITIFAALLGCFILVERYIFNDALQLHISGSAQLAVILLFLIGIVLGCLGLIALYIGNIHGEVINRPLFVIREIIKNNKTENHNAINS